MDRLHLKYVVSFPILGEKVLLIKRKKDPWSKFWNGLGGHIEKEENPTDAVLRELKEEAKIAKKNIELLKFAGVATWSVNSHNKENTPGGMYIFIVHLSSSYKKKDKIKTGEGDIAWKNLWWACDEKNSEIAKNVPIYLPLILDKSALYNFHFIFKNYDIIKYKIRILKNGYKI